MVDLIRSFSTAARALYMIVWRGSPKKFSEIDKKIRDDIAKNPKLADKVARSIAAKLIDKNGKRITSAHFRLDGDPTYSKLIYNK
ncbi:hypothetical protein LTR85_004865 [Meristemomyces frigidus]|nr:hypothetical protein LTR85_004865 [Meristemomyces frigidus]